MRVRQPDQSPVGWAGCAQLYGARTPASLGFYKAILRLVPIVKKKKKWGPDLRSVTLFPFLSLSFKEAFGHKSPTPRAICCGARRQQWAGWGRHELAVPGPAHTHVHTRRERAW